MKETARIMMAAAGSGSGKTLLTCGFIGALKQRNKDVVSCKCGPDYIDPMFHRTVLGIHSENMDTFFTGEEETRELLRSFSTGHEIVVMEGVMGLYDGLGGTKEEGSSYHLAKVTKTPIILVVDVHGMGRTMIPLIQGILSYDAEHLIKGIILNRISKGFYETIRALFEKEVSIPLVGFYENHKELKLESRHLGLCMPEEVSGIKKQLDLAARYFTETIDLKKLMEIAESAEGLYQKKSVGESKNKENFFQNPVLQAVESSYNEGKGERNKPRLAIARDEAFCFYYEANIRALLAAGIELVYFSPLHDQVLPENIQGIYLGGGYPENYAKELSQNHSMLQSIRSAMEKGIVSIAECGGFLYLHKELLVDDNSYSMVGAVDGIAKNTGKLVRFGYVEIREKSQFFLSEGTSLKGHEFHYYDSSFNGNDCEAMKPTTGKKWDCIHVSENHWWGFAHMYFPSNLEFVHNLHKIMKSNM